MAERLVEDIFTALDEQTVVVPGTDAAALIVPSLASSLQAVLDQRKLLATRIEELLEAHPLSKVLTSMPGIGVRTGARILIDVGDGSSDPYRAKEHRHTRIRGRRTHHRPRPAEQVRAEDHGHRPGVAGRPDHVGGSARRGSTPTTSRTCPGNTPGSSASHTVTPCTGTAKP